MQEPSPAHRHEAQVAVDRDALLGVDSLGRHARAQDCGDLILARDDGAINPARKIIK
jgi:hypothetical protein